MAKFIDICLWIFATLLELSSAALTDQVPLSSPSIIKRFTRAGHIVEIPFSAADRGVKAVDILHDYGDSVAVKFLHFDDVWFGNLSNTSYTSDWEQFTQYERFNVFDAEVAHSNGFIDAKDLDCAASKPNALHNSPMKYNTPSVIRSNVTALNEAGLSEFFDVVAWTWKPIGPAVEFPWLNMDLWRIEGDDEDRKVTFVDTGGTIWPWGPGYFDPDTWIPREFIDDWGHGVNWIEVDAKAWEDGKGGEPVNFCLDNLILVFYPKE